MWDPFLNFVQSLSPKAHSSPEGMYYLSKISAISLLKVIADGTLESNGGTSR